MDDQNLTNLLQKTVAGFDPSRAHVDLDRARKSGRRRHLLTHIAAPTGSALAVVAIVAGLFAAVPHGTAAGSSTAPMSAATPPSSKAATASPEAKSTGISDIGLPQFGWLPAGFSLANADFHTNYNPEMLESISANGPGGGDAISLLVSSAPNAKLPGGGKTALDVNGKPAEWTNGGDEELQWEQAPGEVVMLSYEIGLGQVDSNLGASVEAVLLEVASHVQWGKGRLVFPFQFTHDLPSSWTPVTGSAQYTDGHLVATSVTLGLRPTLATAPQSSGDVTETKDVLEIDVQPFSSSAPSCAGPSSQTSYIEADGVRWQYQAQDNYGNNKIVVNKTSEYVPTQGLCSVGAIDGQSVRLLLTLDKVTENAKGNVISDTQYPGLSEIGSGGVKTVLSWMKFLGPNPATWTTNPLAD